MHRLKHIPLNGGRRTPRGVRGLKLLLHSAYVRFPLRSHPSRGAWIEIHVAAVSSSIHSVAPLAGCVD